jgi:hypothetical protein
LLLASELGCRFLGAEAVYNFHKQKQMIYNTYFQFPSLATEKTIVAGPGESEGFPNCLGTEQPFIEGGGESFPNFSQPLTIVVLQQLV